jgi:hypothetical protein
MPDPERAGRRKRGSTTERPGPSRIASASVVVLAVATVLAIFYAQELKHRTPLLIKTPPGVVTFSPLGPGTREAHFHVKASLSGFVEVAILPAETDQVAAVVSHHKYLHEYRTYRFDWNGRTSSGRLARPGQYRVRVRFLASRRIAVVPYYTLTLREP